MNDLLGGEGVGGKPDGWPEDYEAQFWKAYPRRVAKKAAMKALVRARKGKASWVALMAGVARYAEQVAGKDPQYVAHPATWINGERWDDEPPAPATTGPGGPRRGPSLFSIATGRR